MKRKVCIVNITTATITHVPAPSLCQSQCTDFPSPSPNGTLIKAPGNTADDPFCFVFEGGSLHIPTGLELTM